MNRDRAANHPVGAQWPFVNFRRLTLTVRRGARGVIFPTHPVFPSFSLSTPLHIFFLPVIIIHATFATLDLLAKAAYVRGLPSAPELRQHAIFTHLLRPPVRSNESFKRANRLRENIPVNARVTTYKIGRLRAGKVYAATRVEYNGMTIFFFFTVRPLTVEINKIEGPLVADRRYTATCRSTGSRPNAIITWYKGKRQLKRTKVI